MRFNLTLLFAGFIGLACGWVVPGALASDAAACIGGENWASIGYNNNTAAGNVEGCCDDDMRTTGWNPDVPGDWGTPKDLDDVVIAGIAMTLSRAVLLTHDDLDVTLTCWDSTACPTTTTVISGTQGNDTWLFGAVEPDIDDCECRDDCEGS